MKNNKKKYTMKSWTLFFIFVLCIMEPNEVSSSKAYTNSHVIGNPI